MARQSVKMNLMLLNGSIFLKLVIQTQLFGKNEKNRKLAIDLMSAAAGMGGDYAKQQLDEMYKQTTGMDVPADRSWANEEN